MGVVARRQWTGAGGGASLALYRKRVARTPTLPSPIEGEGSELSDTTPA